MKVLVFFLAFVALATAEKDWSRIINKDLKVAPVDSRGIPHKPSTRISNGNEAVPHSRPWQVALFIPVSGSDDPFFCGGSLIDEQNVLTSGYCVSMADGPIEVVLGAHNIQEDEATQVVVTSSDYLPHEVYNWANDGYDIGLIRLPSPVTLNEYIQPISVDNSSCSDDYAGQDANMSGWGEDESGKSSPVLREVTTPVLNYDDCFYYYGTSLWSSHMCTDPTGDKYACYDDYGGPLVLNDKQIGISVRPMGHLGYCGGVAGLFIRVCEFGGWIEDHKKQ